LEISPKACYTLAKIGSNIGDFRERNHRQFQHIGNQRAEAFAWAELPEIGERTYDTGRNGGDGRREMYLDSVK